MDNELSEALNYYKKQNRKRLTRIIISIIAYFLGVIMIIVGLAEGTFQMVVVGVICCGIYTGLTWRKAAKEAHEEEERENGATYTVTEDGIYKNDGFWFKLIFFLIGVAIGTVITPIRVIIDIVNYCRTKKIIKGLQA